jgi:hypothetical protein
VPEIVAQRERIPDERAGGAGIGFVWSDGEAEPARVRAGFPTDDDIEHIPENYRPGRPRSIEVTSVPTGTQAVA